jgi:hypothetical protein
MAKPPKKQSRQGSRKLKNWEIAMRARKNAKKRRMARRAVEDSIRNAIVSRIKRSADPKAKPGSANVIADRGTTTAPEGGFMHPRHIKDSE